MTTAEVDEPGGVWARGRRRLTAGLVLTVTLVAFESLAVSAVMPEVADDLGQLGLYGWVFSGFFLGNLVGIVLAGQAADRRSPAVPFAAGLGLFAVGLLAAGAAPSMPVLVAARVAQGLGAGAIPAVAYASVGRAYPPLLRPRVFAVFSTAWIVPGVVGPAAATAIAHASSWRWVFLALLPFVGAAAAIALPSLRGLEPVEGVPSAALDRARAGRAVALAAGAGLVLAGPSGGHVAAGTGLAVLGLPLAAWAFLRLVPPGTVRVVEGIPAAIAVRGVLTFAFFGVNSFVPLALTDARGQPDWVGGTALTVATFTWTSAAWVQQRAVHTVGPRRLVRGGMVLLALGIAAGAVACTGGPPVPVAIALWGLAGFGTGLSYAPLAVTVLALAAPGEQGAATAGLQLTDVLGVAVGTGATGVFVAAGEAGAWSTSTSLRLGFALCAAVAVVAWAFARRLPARL